ncbi:MAG: proton-conducting transporter membrane subunit, partial [Desulfatirhabdiaceae bacterium]
ILRINQVCIAAGLAEYGQTLLVGFGLFSMLVAASFIVKQLDFKRLLAYSSVEHMGILSLGIGLGGDGVYAAMLHAVNHSLTKAMLFLVAGNILAVSHSKSTTDIRGISSVLPINGILWIAGFLAITGSPPFGLFVSELLVLKAALDQGHVGIAMAYLGLLGIIFIGMAAIFCKMAQGYPAGLPTFHISQSVPNGTVATASRFFHESPLSVLPPIALGMLAMLLGLFIPSPLQQALIRAAATVSGQ